MKPAITFAGTSVPADVFFDRWQRSAAALHTRGVGPGSVVALLLHNEPVQLELRLALRWLGARVCALESRIDADALHSVLSDRGTMLLLVHADLLGAVAGGIPSGVQVLSVTPPAHPCRILALPGRVDRRAAGSWEQLRDVPGRRVPPQRTPANVEAAEATCRAAFGIGPDARALVGVPLHDDAAAAFALTAALHGAQLVIEPRFDAARTLQLVASLRLTHLHLVATMLVQMLRLPADVCARHDLSSIRFVACTGPPCPGEVKRQVIEWWGPVIHESWACPLARPAANPVEAGMKEDST